MASEEKQWGRPSTGMKLALPSLSKEPGSAGGGLELKEKRGSCLGNKQDLAFN